MATTQRTPPAARPGPIERAGSAFLQRHRLDRAALRVFSTRYAVVGVWIAMAAVYATISPDKFLRTATIQSIFSSQQSLVFLTMGALCTFVVGEFDLSIASTMGLSATIVPVLSTLHHQNVVFSCIVAVLAASASGLLNGVLVVALGVDALIVTLGTGTFLLGIAAWMSDQTTVSGVNPSLSKIATYSIGGLPISFYYGLVIAIAFAYLLGCTPLGRHMTFVGANAEVARLAGVNVNRIRIGSYVVGATIAGVGGVILVASVGGYDPTASAQYLLPTFAAAFLGTAVVRPGQFNPLGAMVGIYFLTTGILGLEILGLNGWIQNVFYGAALILAVSIATVVRRRARS